MCCPCICASTIDKWAVIEEKAISGYVPNGKHSVPAKEARDSWFRYKLLFILLGFFSFPDFLHFKSLAFTVFFFFKLYGEIY